MNTKIYIAGSKQNKFLELDESLYCRKFVDEKWTGDYIYHLNPWYSEVTVLYDIWKHSTEDIVGLCHYRRYFEYNGHVLTKNNIELLLSTNDVIMYKWVGESAFQAMRNGNAISVHEDEIGEMQNTGIRNELYKYVNIDGVHYAIADIYKLAVLKYFPELMLAWKLVFPTYNTSKLDKYSVDELLGFINNNERKQP